MRPTPPHRPHTLAHAPSAEAALSDAWTLLRQLAAGRLAHLRAQRPRWSAAQAVAHLAVRRTPFLLQLLAEAGFADEVTEADSVAVVLADAHLRQSTGSADWEAVARATGLPLARIESILTAHGGYGVDAYGSSPYGGRRQRSLDGAPVSRQVSSNGQFSYAGRTYGLGRLHQGRAVLIRERAHHLDVESADGRRLRLTK